MSSTINPNLNREAVESALRTLEANLFDVKALWREHAQRLASWDTGAPDADDMRYVLPAAPPRLEDHLRDGANSEMSANVLWDGFSYTLTPGQRAWLRDNYDLTPTETVTAVWIERWPGTVHPRAMRIDSDLHVPASRKHVLKSVVIRNVGRFFRESEERDAAERKERVFAITPTSLDLGRLFNLESVERWAVEDITGVKVQSRVEVVAKTETHFRLVCFKTGNQANVPRSEYFPLVEEYAKLHNSPRKRRSAPFGPTPGIDEILKSMGLPLA